MTPAASLTRLLKLVPARRRWLQSIAQGVLALAVLRAWPARAQGMVSGQLLSLPVLVDNGSLVPVRVQVDSPMTEQDHITHIYLLSQRNPVTQMAVFHLGPWSGRAEVSARLRLAGSQLVVALARRSDGSFCYQSADALVTESACVDGS